MTTQMVDHSLLLSLLICTTLLSGCASMNESECKTADWRLIGYEDGMAGRSTAQLREHRQDCAEHGVSPDLDLYLKGHQAGLLVYCKPNRAFSLGRSGNAYPRLCPDNLSTDLKPAYQDGVKVYKQRNRLKKLKQRLDQKHKKQKEMEQTLDAYEAELIAGDTSKTRRLEILADTVNLSKRQDELKAEIIHLEERVKTRRSNLKRLEASFHY